MSESPRIGIIGCGYWGPNYVRVFNELFPSSVKWCCDLDQNRLDKFRNIIPGITTDYKDILRDNSIDAVCISTPATTHFKIVKDALSYKKHVLVEKPITTDYAQAIELREEAKKSSCALLVGHIYKYHPAIRKLKDLLIKEDLGDIYYGYSSRTGLGPIRYDVNAMWDLTPHDISEFIELFSELPIAVSAEGVKYLSNKEDVVFLTLKFRNNRFAKIHASWLDPVKVRRLTLVGNKKMAVYDDVAPSETVKIYNRSLMPDNTIASFGEFRLVIQEGDILIPNLGHSEPLKILVNKFVDLMKNPLAGIDDLDDAISVIRILEAAQYSITNGNQIVELSYPHKNKVGSESVKL